MGKKLSCFLMFAFVIFMLMSCSESSNKPGTANNNVQLQTKVEEPDTLKAENEDSLDFNAVAKTEALSDVVEPPVKKSRKEDVFKIYKNGVRQNLVIAWTPTPDEASEDYVWFVHKVNKYFSETNPVENLMFYSWPPDGITDNDMHNFAKEMGHEDAYAGYYLISADGEKGFIQHNVFPQVISGIYTFFNIQEPIVK
jgi:hypothetical protein